MAPFRIATLTLPDMRRKLRAPVGQALRSTGWDEPSRGEKRPDEPAHTQEEA